MTSLADVESQAQDAFSFISGEASQGAEKAKGLFAKVRAKLVAEIATMRAREADVPATSVKIDATHGVSLGLCLVLCGVTAIYAHRAGEQAVLRKQAQYELTGAREAVTAANARDAVNVRKARQQQDAIDAYARELAAKPKERTVHVQGKPVVIRDDTCLLGADGARRLRDILAASPR